MITVGDVLKYIPTSTVGKVTDVREKDGKIWAKLDSTNLYYEISLLQPADPSEYKAVSYKEREKKSSTARGAAEKTFEDLQKEEDELDISGFAATGGG